MRVVDSLAVAITGAGALSAAIVLARTRSGVLALGVLLDLFTAAGLVRLTGPPNLARTATAALVILIRHVAVYGLGVTRRADVAAVARPHLGR